MAEAFSPECITGDMNFQKLAARATKLDEFNELLEKHACGYTQRKRIADGLKSLSSQLEAIDNKLYIMKSVGKAKSKLDDDEQFISETYLAADLKEKTSAINAIVQTMLDEGKISAEEKPHILDNLRSRRDKAKADNKEKLLEKLEKNITSVIKAEGTDLPLLGLPEIAKLNSKRQYIEILEKKKDLKKAEQQEIDGKGALLEKIAALEQAGRWWFETDIELDTRVKKALRVYAETEKERKQKEEEDAFEEMKRKQEHQVEEKRLEALAKEKKKEEELKAKLDAKRAEAAAKPQKEVPKAKPKAKKRIIKLDNKDLFQDSSVAQDYDFQPEDRVEDYAENVDEVGASHEKLAADEDVDVDELISKNADPVEEVADAELQTEEKTCDSVDAAADLACAQVEETVEVQPVAKAPAKKAPAKEPAWKAPVVTDGADDVDVGETAEPSLAEAAAAAKAAPVKKTPPPQPKKKEKKKFAKVGAAELGFEC